MSKRQLKSIDIDFFKKNKNITFYLIMIVFLICLLISKLNLSYGSSSKSYVSECVGSPIIGYSILEMFLEISCHVL